MLEGPNAAGYAVLGLTAIVALLVAVLAFAALRFAAAARDTRYRLRDSGMETALLSAALEDAIGRLKAQERESAARAERSERLSGQIVAGLTAGLIVVERDGRVVTVNPAATRILGIAEPGGDPPHGRYLERLPALAGLIGEGLARGEPIVRRTITVTRETGPAHLGVTVSPIADAAGGIQAVVCLFTDLTGVMAREEQLRLKESFTRLGELTAGIAHEFRNGLATIHGYGRLLDPEALPPAYRPYVEGIRAETTALGEVVTNFLNFARPDTLALVPVDLDALVARAVEDGAPAGATTIGGSFATVEGDEVLLRQALSNLLRNAVEACTSAGTVPAIAVEGVVDPATGMQRIHVRDNGPGLPREAPERIFQPFFTTRASGTGLGLAIVQKVIVAHNGRVTATSLPGGGAEFVLHLPLA
ncbi:MAG: nitrogen regulation protein NR(II) [Vicinamibacterales bacterium]